MNATNAMLCWNPDSAVVALVPWPDKINASGKYKMTGLACNLFIQKLSFEDRKKIVFIEAMHLIIRDKCEPMAVHKALLGLEEYVAGCAPDMPIPK